MFTQVCYSLLMVVSCFIGVYTSVLKLTPTQVYAQENSSATITCSKTNGTLLETRWENSEISQDANLAFYNGKCFVTRFLLDSDLFDGVCNGNGTYSVVLKRIDRRQHGAEWMCKEFADALSNKVVIHVSVPATSVTLYSSHDNYMNENIAQNVSCITSACRPDPIVQWYLGDSNDRIVHNLTQFSTFAYIDGEYGLKAVESTLHFKPNRTVNGFIIYCEVWTRKDAADILSREVFVNVTYPPENNPEILGFETSKDLSVTESDTGTFVCSVTGGNPLASLIWNCFGSTDTTLETKGNIAVSTVKWTAYRNYNVCSCLANHSTGWQKITTVKVNVHFPTEIKRFSLSTMNTENTVIINETDNASLICLAEGNPAANLTIINPYGENTFEVSNSNVARYSLHNASYLNAGEYTCIGRNNYTKASSARSRLKLIVRCPPRPSSGDRSVVKVAALLHKDEMLTFTAMKYLDEPNKTAFKWFKENKPISDNGIKYTIRSDDLQTNLSIRNTSTQDLGPYRVFIRNSVGEYIHYYQLNAAGKPEPPKDFRIIDNSVTDSTVTLTWSPGFNGGLEQTFVFVYKMKMENSWLNDSIIDNERELMSYAIYGLSSMQEYEMEMYAKNREGKSAITERLQFKTKASKRIFKETICSTNTGIFVGIGAGTFIAAFVIFMVLFIGYKQFRKLKKSHLNRHQKGNLNEHQLTVTEENQASSTYTDLDGNKKEVNVYDDLNVQNMSTSHEQQDLTSPETAEMRNARGTSREKIEYINIKI